MKVAVSRRLVAALTAVTAALAGFGHAAATAAEPVVIDHGHVDMFNLSWSQDGKELVLGLKEDVTGQGVHRKAEDVLFVVKPEALVSNVPADRVPSGLGSTFYHLPLTQNPNLLWPGWDSLELKDQLGGDLKADIKITAVDGPGEIYLWSADTFGGIKPLLANDSYKMPGVIHQDQAAHTHANWAFTKAGTYKLTVQATASKADGSSQLTSNQAVYTIQVGNAAPAPVEPAPTAKPAPTGAPAPVEPAPTGAPAPTGEPAPITGPTEAPSVSVPPSEVPSDAPTWVASSSPTEQPGNAGRVKHPGLPHTGDGESAHPALIVMSLAAVAGLAALRRR